MSSEMDINQCQDVRVVFNENFILYWEQGVVNNMFSDFYYSVTSIHSPFKAKLRRSQNCVSY